MAHGQRRIRVGIDTGGTFTDVVAFDEDTGELVTTKTPSTPANPADGFIAGIEKILGVLEATGDDITAVCHGTTVATNKLLEGKVERLGFITTEGYEFMLEIARQAVPDGYGNSYFWVKPPRIVAADHVRTVGGRMDFEGNELRPFDDADAVAAARWFRAHDITTIGVCFLHSYANDEHERAMREVLRREHPEAVVSISAEVLREYREYERSMTTLVDAAVKPNVSRYVSNIHARLDGFTGGRPIPFYVMKSNGGVLSADEVVHQPITTVLSGPAAGALGAALIARRAGFARVLTCDGGGTSTDVSVVLDGEPTLTTEGTVGAYPSKIPMIDVVTVGAGGGSIAWVTPEGTLKVGPQSAGADPGPLCYGKGGTEPTITDAHVVLGRIPPHLLGGEIPLDVDAGRATASRLWLPGSVSTRNVVPQASSRSQRGTRPTPCARCRSSGASTCATSCSRPSAGPGRSSRAGSSTSSTSRGRRAAEPRQRVGVRAAHRRRQERLHAQTHASRPPRSTTTPSRRSSTSLDGPGHCGARHRGVPPRPARVRAHRRPALLRPGLRGAGVGRPGAGRRGVGGGGGRALPRRAPPAAQDDFRDDPRQQVEWVNLRVTGVGPITRPELAREIPARVPGSTDGSHQGQVAVLAARSSRPVCFDAEAGYVATDVYWRPDLRAGDTFSGPAIVEEFGSTVPVHPGFTVRVDAFGNLVVTKEAQ